MILLVIGMPSCVFLSLYIVIYINKTLGNYNVYQALFQGC